MFFVVPTVGVVIISGCVYYSGGWDSFPYALYTFAVIFYAIYSRPALAAVGAVLTVLAGASPAIYQPDAAELLEYALIRTPILFTLAGVSGYMVRQVILRDRSLRASEVELKSVQREAEIDGLTGISNRRHLEKEISRSLEIKKSFTLLFTDIDNFKQVNDLHGHLLGDEVLKLVASTLKSCARRADIVARYGGEEFIVLAPDATVDNARSLFERVREETIRASEEKFGFRVYMSAGAVDSREIPKTGNLLEAADEAMYEAKRRGKDRLFVPEVRD